MLPEADIPVTPWLDWGQRWDQYKNPPVTLNQSHCHFLERGEKTDWSPAKKSISLKIPFLTIDYLSAQPGAVWAGFISNNPHAAP